MKSDLDKGVYVTIKISMETNKKLNSACERSGRTKKQEVKMRIEHHLIEYRSISEVNYAVKHVY